jgi:hypothetical protein
MASIATKIFSSRLMIYNAARAIDENSPDKIILSSMAKKCNHYSPNIKMPLKNAL